MPNWISAPHISVVSDTLCNFLGRLYTYSSCCSVRGNVYVFWYGCSVQYVVLNASYCVCVVMVTTFLRLNSNL